ncbi:MAG: EF-hand domain-containing protein [Betaproteobacteria bacterium]|nr:EF-hand domain-containing protein [Betaproteobacteria bacterium]
MRLVFSTLAHGVLITVLCLSSGVNAQVTPSPDPQRAGAEVTMLDPWVPPSARKAAPAVPTQGAALQEQVERKLKQRFDAAATQQSGSLTKAQAEAAGLGFIAQNFDAIDTRKTGAVRFDDVKRYLRERGAVLN